MKPLLALFLFVVLAREAQAFDHAYASLARVLAAQVKNGEVDYSALKAAPVELNACLADMAAVKEGEFKTWTEQQQIAFLVNLYNSSTLQLVADHYPVKSIKKIGGLLGNPWKLEAVRLWGRMTTLDEIEHGLLRARYAEPRVHFALVCAARSCPPLRAEPYVADRLDAQLTDQARRFFAQPAKNRVDAAAGTLWLSPIFRWFAADFTKDGRTLEQFVTPFFDEADAKRIREGGLRVKFTEYDWSLNSR